MGRLKFTACFDSHGKLIDKKASRPFLEFVKDFKPDIKIHGGDAWDFKCLMGKATRNDENDDFNKDYDAGWQFLDEYNPSVLLLGNHEYRLWKLLGDVRGIVRGYARELVGHIKYKCKQKKCRLIPYDARRGIYQLGNVQFLHGYGCGDNAAKFHAQVYGNCIFGHIHKFLMARAPSTKESIARSIGCLCKLDLDYMDSKPGKLQWEHGWAYGFVNEKTGKTQVFEARKTGSSWLLPTSFKEYGR